MTYPIVSIDEITPKEVASITDHTFLKTPESFTGHEDGATIARRRALDQFVEDTLELPSAPYVVMVQPGDLQSVREKLDMVGSTSKLGTVLGFPDPLMYTDEMIGGQFWTAVDHGATEFDSVFFMGTAGITGAGPRLGYIQHLIERAGGKNRGLVHKVILETGNIPSRYHQAVIRTVEDSGADFVKTSTGYGKVGATEASAKRLRELFPRGVKLSQGVNPDNYQALLHAASGRHDGNIELDPMKIRLGASGLLAKLYNP